MLTNILTQSLWRDEAFSVLLGIKNFGEIISITAKDFSPPLYYFLLHLWMKIFGSSEIAVRSLSVLFLILTAASTYILAKKIFSKKVGLLASALVLLNPFLFYYSFEARFYTLLCFLATLSFYFLITERWPLFVLFSLLGLYTHNFMIFSLAGAVLAYVLLKGFEKKQLLVLSLGTVAVGFSPWIAVLFSQTKSVASGFWIQRPGIEDILRAVVQFMLGPLGNCSPYLIFAALALLLFALSQAGRLKRTPKALLVWASAPFFLSILVSYLVPIFLPRYLIFMIPPLMMVLAFILLRTPARIPLIGVLLIFFLVRDFQLWQNPNKFPIREEVAALSQSWSGELIICESILNFFEVKYYLLRSNPAAVESLRLLSSGKLTFAGGALVEEEELIENPPQGSYFWMDIDGNVSYEFGGFSFNPAFQ